MHPFLQKHTFKDNPRDSFNIPSSLFDTISPFFKISPIVSNMNFFPRKLKNIEMNLKDFPISKGVPKRKKIYYLKFLI